MKVFVSWSGKPANDISKELSEFLPTILPGVECFQSSEGIGKGARWSTEIAKELQDTNIGILCLTKENIEAPWIAFEAGALSKSVGESKVSPLLFGITPSEIAGGPLSQFQATIFGKDEIRKLITDISKKDSDEQKKRSAQYFEKFWPDFEQAIEKSLVQKVSLKKPLKDPVMKMLEDIRGSQMFVQNRMRNPETFLPFWTMQKALLLAQDPKHLSAKLINHAEMLEDLLDTINNEVTWVDTDDADEMRDKLSEIEPSTDNFEKLEDFDPDPE